MLENRDRHEFSKDRIREEGHESMRSAIQIKIRAIVCVLLLPILFFFTGCFTGDILQNIAEQPELTEMIEVYMQEKGIPGEVREATMIADRPAQDYSYVTDYGKGEWVTEDGTIDFACNIKTKEVYTSEKREAFEKACIQVFSRELGLDPDRYDMALRFTLWSDPVDLGEEYGERSHPLGAVLPTDISDMDGYAEESFRNENMSLSFIITLRDGETPPELSELDMLDWQNTMVTAVDGNGNQLERITTG